MTRRSDAGKFSIPAAAVGVVVVGAGVAAARHFGREETAPEPQYANMGKFPSLTEFSVNKQRVGLSSSQRGIVRLPELEFEVFTPKAKTGRLEAWVEGGGGKRLGLVPFMEQSESRMFGRLGLDREIESPRLVVQNNGKTVIEKKLDPLPKPMRAIPLVVPIDRSVRLRPVPESESAGLRAKYPGEAFYTVEGEKARTLPTHLLRSEWAANAEMAFQMPGTNRPPVFALPTNEPPRIVELDEPDFFFETSTEETDMEIEIVEVKGRPAMRVTKAVNLTFKDGARVEILPQERIATGGSMERNVGLSSRELMGYTLAIVPRSKPFSIDPVPPRRRENIHLPQFDDLWNTKVELISPPLASLGLNRLRIGAHEFKAKEGPKPPLAYGSHSIRLRFSRKSVLAIDRRRFIEVVR